MKNCLFVGGPMNGKFSPMPDDSGHVVAKSDNIMNPRTGKPMEWKYYRKYVSTPPVKRRDGRKVPRCVEVFVYEGYKMDVAEVRKMLLHAVPRVLPDQIKMTYSHTMNGMTVYLRQKQKSRQVVVLDKEIRESAVKFDLCTRLARMGTSPARGTVEVPVNEESLALFNELAAAS